MTDDQAIGRGEILALTTEIVSAHLANNAVVQNEVPELIQSVFSKLNETRRRRGAGLGRADAGGADQEVGDGGLHHLPRGRQEAQDAEAASDDRLQHDAGGVPGEVGPEAGLSDGGAELRRQAAGAREEDRARAEAAGKVTAPALEGRRRRRLERGTRRRSRAFCFPGGRMPAPKKLFVKTYGCQMNVYDSERMTAALAARGLRGDRRRPRTPT